MTALNELAEQRYLNLETFRRNGVGVRTPVWFASAHGTDDDMRLYIYSGAEAGKVKRIRHTGTVRVAPCDMRGRLTGGWIDAHATMVTGEEANRGMQLLNRKYWPWKSMLDTLSRLSPRARRAMIVIRAA
jgi:uncharacterized protein